MWIPWKALFRQIMFNGVSWISCSSVQYAFGNEARPLNSRRVWTNINPIWYLHVPRDPIYYGRINCIIFMGDYASPTVTLWFQLGLLTNKNGLTSLQCSLQVLHDCYIIFRWKCLICPICIPGNLMYFCSINDT